MKLFHISDLHIGKILHEVNLLEEQKIVLAQVLALVDLHMPDGSLIAGDIYDKAVPSAEAVKVFDTFLSELADRGLSVFLISGNHDSSERIHFASRILQKENIFIKGIFDGKLEPVEAYSETDMMMGVRFLQQYAIREKKPLVICVGLGTASGSRTGALPFADLLNTLARQVNTVVVTCTGNEANNRTHTSGLAVSDTEPSEIEITVGADERGFVMEIWAESLDILSVAITSPSGERISRIPARIDTGGVYNFLLERSQVAVNYRVVESASGYEVIFMRFINPAQGIWKIHVYSLTNIVGRYNAWLPLKQFLSGDTYFLNSNPSTTLTEPGAAERVISVGAYNHITDASYVASGRGYTATGLVKPDFVAPGVDVYGVRAGGGYTTRTGTSVAAAHAAGAAALLLTWGVTDGNLPYMGTNEVKSVLIRGAKRENNTVYPNNIYGYGKMDVIEAFYKLRTG